MKRGCQVGRTAFKARVIPALAAGAIMALGLGATAIAAPKAAPGSDAGKAVIRRLTPEQYRSIISEVFGKAIELGGRFEPDARVDNLIEIGTARISVSSEGMAQFDVIARSVATQVVNEPYRHLIIPCKPKSEAAADEACARQFLTRVGGLLFRRPLSQDEQQRFADAAGAAADASKNFYTGLSLSVAGMLESPQFLFRRPVLEPDPDHRGQFRLDAYSKASRLSFFLWNTMPDDELIAAAQRGDLNTPKGLQREVSRMLASPKFDQGVRAFFADMFQFDEMTGLAKDATLYPKFDSIVAADAQEQTLRTIVDLLVRRHGDYRDIFTTHKTFLTAPLASIYDVAMITDVPNGSPDTWQSYEFPADDPRGGVLTHLSFVALHSHPGRSSPTLRGKALREIMLCQKVPAPPGDVKFDIVQDTSNPDYKTARARLTAHRTNPVCAGCHKLIDPMGLALENFDGGGGFRTAENGVTIDTSGELDGVKFTNAAELGKAVHDNPAATSCVIDRISAYALGRVPVAGEAAWVEDLKKVFAKNHYALPDVMQKIVLSPEFYRAAPPEPVLTKTTLLTP